MEWLWVDLGRGKELIFFRYQISRKSVQSEPKETKLLGVFRTYPKTSKMTGLASWFLPFSFDDVLLNHEQEDLQVHLHLPLRFAAGRDSATHSAPTYKLWICSPVPLPRFLQFRLWTYERNFPYWTVALAQLSRDFPLIGLCLEIDWSRWGLFWT